MNMFCLARDMQKITFYCLTEKKNQKEHALGSGIAMKTYNWQGRKENNCMDSTQCICMVVLIRIAIHQIEPINKYKNIQNKNSL